LLKTRLIVGTLLIAALLAALWIDLHLDFAYASFSILVLAGTAGAVEWTRIMGEGKSTYPLLLVSAAVLYPVMECLRIVKAWSGHGSDALFISIFLLMLLGRAVFSGHVQDGLDRVARTLLGFVMLFLYYRLVPVLLDRDAGGGLRAAYVLVLTSKSCDMGAFLIGYTLGKRKLIPRVSPGKTLAGALGGIASSAAVGGATLSLMLGDTVAFGILFGVVSGAVTMLSDLAESLVKRCAGVKDSSALLPHFGGVLDMIDSLILAAPVGYLLLTAF
jgi:phosphatidate cytidylyltransferase